jgi:iron complex transport system substrate-binding protein
MNSISGFSKSRNLGCKLLVVLAYSILVFCAGCCIPSDSERNNTSSANSWDHRIEITNYAGNAISLPHTANRIICINEDACQMLIAIDAGNKIVGVSDYMIKNRPSWMAHMPNAKSIGDWQNPSVEKSVALNPDIIITYGSSRPQNADQFIAANLTLVPLDCYKIPTLASDARILGTITGKEERAEQYAAEVEESLHLINSRLNISDTGVKPLRAYIEGYQDYSAFGNNGQGHHIARLLRLDTIATNNTLDSFTVSPEFIVSENPDIIIKIAITPFSPNPSLETIRERIMARPGFDHIIAVETGRVYVINTDIINDPRGTVGLLYLAKAIYPDRFSDIDPYTVLIDYSDQFIPGFNNVETIVPLSGNR